jgi:tetratricopeptide (TPR) repeat protein
MTIPDLGERNTSDTAQADRQASLAADLLNRFRDLGERRDADSAVTHARAAADLAGTSDNLLLLTAALQVRFDHYGDLADLDVLLDAGRRTVAATPEGHPQRFAALSHLSVAVRTRYEHTGVDRDLDEAVDLSRAAVDAASEPGHRAKCRSNLGLALRMRAAVTGDVDDLDEAVAAFEAALDDLHADHHDRGLVLQNLAGTLRNRAASARQPEDLDAAIGHLGEALSTTPETSLRWGSYAAKLSSALRHRYRDQREPADLELAVALARRAADAPDATESVALERIASLGRALLTRGEADRSVTDLDEAIDQLRQAARISDGSYNQAVVHTELGIALWARHALAGNPHDAAEGDTILRGVVESDLPVSVRLHAAEEWGTAALGQPDGARSALDAYTHAVRLLPLSAWRGIDERSRERVLSNSRIAGGAAGAAIAAGHPHQALELLEQSRAVGWSQQLELRSDLTALAAAAPATAGRLAAARTAMHAQDRRMAPAGRKQRIAASREWDAAVAEARTVPGFAGFLRPAAASDLYRAAAAGPVIIVGITEPRCVALVVTTDDVIPVPLPMDKAQLEAHSLAFLAASQVLGSADLDLDLIVAREEVLTETLSWLWDTVARPVLDALGIGPAADGDTVWPRVWWCPIGTMSLMPLHAAGHHARCDGSTVLDRVVSSYTPTLNTLIAVRERIGPVPDAGEPFLVIAPDDAVGPHLPAAAEERQLLRELLGADHCRLLTGADATVEAVREALGQHRLFHLNGHGWQDLFNPSTARIDLADGGITLTELAGAERADGDFAFLSACHTMTGGMNVPDEVMTLASAVQFAGFRHVLGTLWAVPDASAGALSAAFYRHLADGGRLRTDRSAVALHRSVRGLREDAEELPSLWAPFIHAGP